MVIAKNKNRNVVKYQENCSEWEKRSRWKVGKIRKLVNQSRKSNTWPKRVPKRIEKSHRRYY